MDFEKFKLISDNGICSFFNRKLHRYNKVDDYLLDSLKYNYLWFSNPKDFNDPYDCNLHFDFDNTPEEIEEFAKAINELPENSYRKMSQSQLAVRIKELIDNPEIFYKNDVIQNEEEVEKIGICCFSENGNNLLMWSHYADKHKGVCLSFDANCDKDLFLVHPFCVEYLSKFPKINWIKNRGNFKLRQFAFATKSTEWLYEEEVRIMRDNRLHPYRGKIKFNKDALKSITFGYKSNTNDQLKVKEVLNNTNGYDHVRVYSAKLKKFEFGIEYEEIL